METPTVKVPLRGPYDLREVALMGFGHRDEDSFDGIMRLGFCVDGDHESQVGVALRQDGDTLVVTVEQSAGPPAALDRITAQASRVVSVDRDGQAYADLCRADPTLAPVFARAPGFRPANYSSPYEAAVWSIVSARRPRSQGIALRERLAAAYGTVLTVAGQAVPVVPTPSRLLEVDQLPGLPADRIPRLHAIAEAAQRGDLAVDRLTALGVDAAKAELQLLPGIGPFYSSLIMVRGCGSTDVLAAEPQVLKHLEATYGRRVDAAELERMAEAWRPWRTWVLVMLRAVGGRAESGRGDAGG